MRPAKKTKRRPITTEDAERIEEMIDSRGWQLYEQRVIGTLSRHVSDLALDHNEVETAKLRGQVAALKLVLELPGMIAKEARLKGASNDGHETV